MLKAQTQLEHSSTRAGKNRDLRPRHTSNGKRPSSAGSKKDLACFVCGSSSHRAAKCPDRVQPDEGKQNYRKYALEQKQKGQSYLDTFTYSGGWFRLLVSV